MSVAGLDHSARAKAGCKQGGRTRANTGTMGHTAQQKQASKFGKRLVRSKPGGGSHRDEGRSTLRASGKLILLSCSCCVAARLHCVAE